MIIPMFALLFLVIDLAWAVFASASLQESVREGVRFAVTGQLLPGSQHQDDSICQVVQKYSFGFVSSTNAASVIHINYYDPLTLTEKTGPGSNAGGNLVKVTVTGLSLKPLMPLWRSSSPLMLSASASDIVEPSPGGTPPTR